MRSLAEESRSARQDAVIDEAAAEFNRHGVSGASLPQIARRVGLSRVALYHYFKNREDLVFKSYRRSCQLAADDLRKARVGPGTALERLSDFARMTLDPERRPAAVLCEIAYLSEAHRLEVEDAHRANFLVLRSLIEDGWKDGSIRHCASDIAAAAILGILSWIPIASAWVDADDDALTLRMTAAAPQLIAEGVAQRAALSVDLVPDIVRVFPEFHPDAGEPDRREQLARTGSRLFNARGIEGVPVEAIVAELGMTKGLFYHHFPNKAQFVIHCYDRAFDIYDRVTNHADRQNTGLQRLLTGFHMHVQAHVAGLHPMVLLTTFASLPTHSHARFAARTGALMKRYTDFAVACMREGSLKPLDPRAVVFAATGAYSYLSKWSTNPTNRDARHVADEVSRLVFLGLRPR